MSRRDPEKQEQDPTTQPSGQASTEAAESTTEGAATKTTAASTDETTGAVSSSTSSEATEAGAAEAGDPGEAIEASLFGEGSGAEPPQEQQPAQSTFAALRQRISRPKQLAIATGAALVLLGVVLVAIPSDDVEQREDSEAAPELTELSQRMAALEQEFEQRLQAQEQDLEQRISELQQAQETGLDELESALQAHEQTLDQLPSRERLDRLEQRAEELAGEMQALEQEIPEVDAGRFQALEDRIAGLEQTLDNPGLEDARLLGFEHWAGSALIRLAHGGETGRYRPGEAIGDTAWRVSSIDPDTEVAVLRHRDGTLHALQPEERHP